MFRKTVTQVGNGLLREGTTGKTKFIPRPVKMSSDPLPRGIVLRSDFTPDKWIDEMNVDDEKMSND